MRNSHVRTRQALTLLVTLAISVSAPLATEATDNATDGPLPASTVQIIKGPYLQKVTPSSVVVMWETQIATGSRVDYGVNTINEFSVADPALVTIHEVTLPALTANTRYLYAAASGDAQSTVNSFWTAPAEDTVPYRFAVYGDTRSQPDVHASVVQAMVPHEPDFVLHVGDFVANGRIYSEWGPQYFTPAAPLLQNTPLFPVLGNHEYSGTERMWYYDFFATPDNGSTQYFEHWYAVTYGCARFVALNACEGGGDSFLPGSTQYQWLTGELGSPEFLNARWQFVWMHNPPYTAIERDNTVDQNLRTYLVPLFEQYGVDVVFSGDDHFYRHSLRNGIHYIITGGGGAPLHAVGTQMSGATLIYAESTYEYCIVDLTPTTFNLYAAKPDGTVIDTLSLTRSGAPPAPTGLTATPGDTQVSLSWTASPGATSYRVKRSQVSGGPYAELATTAATSYLDTGLINGTTYYYVVSALNAEGLESQDSSEASATPTCAAPAIPTGLQATAGDAQVALAWSISSGATAYNLKRATVRRGPYATIATVADPSFLDTTVQNGTTYFYVVSAVNGCGESAHSARVSATPQGTVSPPQAPTGLTASTGTRTGTIILAWTESSGAEKYNLWRSEKTGGPYALAKAGLTGTSYTNTKLASGTTYFYVVTALNAGGESSYSNEATAIAK